MDIFPGRRPVSRRCPIVGSDVDSLRINVELRDNGSAIVTETWHIDVSDDITEWYLVADNMGQMTIEDLAVSNKPSATISTKANGM